MLITFLGTGSWDFQADRMGPSLLLETQEGNLLVDCGEGAGRRLVAAGLDPTDLDGILITHTHPDHVAGLLPMLFYLRIKTRRKKIPVVAGPRGIRAMIRAMAKTTNPKLLTDEPFFSIREINPPKTFRIGTIEVEARQVAHRDISLGYRITAEGAPMAVSGDSGPSKELAILAREAGLFVCEAAVSKPHKGHLTPEQAGRIGKKARAYKMALVHLPPGADPEEFVERCKAVYGRYVVAPKDREAARLQRR